LRQKFERKVAKFTSVFDTIGKGLEKGILPSMKELNLLANIII
jgi:hypothetical protein